MDKRNIIVICAILALLVAGATAGYLYISNANQVEPEIKNPRIHVK